MKKITKLFAGLVLATMTFVGCANQLEDIIVQENASDNVGTRKVVLELTSAKDANGTPYVDFSSYGNNGAGRSILPEALDVASLKFYLIGTDTVTNKPLTTDDVPEDVTSNFTAASITPAGGGATTSTEKGTITRTFKKSSYSLILAALPSDTPSLSSKVDKKANLLKYASLVAYADVDFRYSEKVNFYLIPNKDSTAAGGKVDLSVYALGWDPSDTEWSTYKIKKTGIFALTDETSATPLGTPSGDFTDDCAITTLKTGIANKKAFTTTANVTAGTYNFTMIFSDGTHDYEYSEDIVIYNNQTTKADVAILPVIGKKPAAPTGFAVGYIDPTTDIENSEYYKVEYKWTDNAVNETYYELETLQIDATGVISSWNSGVWNSKDDWTAFQSAVNTYTTKVYNSKGGNITYGAAAAVSTTKFYEADPNYVSGKLTKNNTTVTMKYALGTRYLARIRAINDAGESEWAYVDLTGGTGFTTATAFPANTTSINRFKLTYNLNGGKEENRITTTPELITFHTQDSVAILNPVKPAASGNYAVYQDVNGIKNYWVKWLKADDSQYNAENSAPAAYTGYTNLTLYADFNAATEADVEIYNIAKYQITDSMIKVYQKVSSGVGATTDATITDKALTVNIAAYKALVFELKTADIKYDNIKVGIKKTYGNLSWKSDNLTQDGSGIASVTKDITSYTPGTYLVTFYAYSPKNDTPYTYYLLLEIVEGAVPTYTYFNSATDSIAIAANGTGAKATVTSSATDPAITYTWYYATTSTLTPASDTVIAGVTTDTISKTQIDTALSAETNGTYYLYAIAKDSKNTKLTPTAGYGYSYTAPVYLASTNTVTITDVSASSKMTAAIGGTPTPTSTVTYKWYWASTTTVDPTSDTEITGITGNEITYTEIETALTSQTAGDYYIYCTATDDKPVSPETIVPASVKYTKS